MLDLWRHVGTQWRGAGFGIIGLDWPAVLRIAALLDLRISRHDFLKLRALEDMELARMNPSDEEDG